MTNVNLTCPTCNLSFQRPAKYFNASTKRGRTMFCSKSCRNAANRNPVIIQSCVFCSKPTNNPKFCNSTCSARYNNRIRIKEPGRIYKCVSCEASISNQRKYCKDCHQKLCRTDYNNVTLKSLKSDNSCSSYHSIVRTHARKVAKSFGMLESCPVCGYSFYVECCHRKPISSFPEDSTLSEVNSADNLIGLCPNHHVEFDKGHISI